MGSLMMLPLLFGEKLEMMLCPGSTVKKNPNISNLHVFTKGVNRFVNILPSLIATMVKSLILVWPGVM